MAESMVRAKQMTHIFCRGTTRAPGHAGPLSVPWHAGSRSSASRLALIRHAGPVTVASGQYSTRLAYRRFRGASGALC